MQKNLYNISVEHLIKIRSHLGHKKNDLNPKNTSNIYGFRHNISIHNLDQIWKSYKYLFHSLTENISKRNSFFLVGTNKNLPMDLLIKNFLEKEKNTKNENNYKSFYITGYIVDKWVKGWFSNWKILRNFMEFIKTSPKKHKKRYQKYANYLKGIDFSQKNPVPDFLLVLHADKNILKESMDFQVPIIGLIDSNVDPDFFLYKFLGNQDSLENIDFFFEFIDEVIKEGRLKEQQMFFFYLLLKLKKNINKKN